MIIGIIIAVLVIIAETFIICSLKLSKKETKIKLTPEEKEKLETAKKAFDNLMNYDYDSAVRGER